MLSAEDRAIVRYGHTPNIIIGPDLVTITGAIRDCSACGAYGCAHWIAVAPSLNNSGYRVVGICSACAKAYVADGRAVDRRTTDDLRHGPY